MPLLKCSANLDNIQESKGKHVSSMDAELVRKTSKIFKLTTTNRVLMKLTVILYLRKIFIDFVVNWLPK